MTYFHEKLPGFSNFRQYRFIVNYTLFLAVDRFHYIHDKLLKCTNKSELHVKLLDILYTLRIGLCPVLHICAHTLWRRIPKWLPTSYFHVLATGAVLGLILIVTNVDCWPWGSDLSCPPGPEPVCPINPSDDTANYFPHPTDCHYYIQCDGSRRPICRQCGPAAYFSPNFLNCLWPLEAKCEHNATTRQDSLLPPICGPDRRPHLDCDSEGSTFRDPLSCDHFFKCTGGMKIRNKCPSGQHFNGLLGACDDPCKAGCKPGIKWDVRTSTIRTVGTPLQATPSTCIPGFKCPTATTPRTCIPGVNCPTKSTPKPTTPTPSCIAGVTCPTRSTQTPSCVPGVSCPTDNNHKQKCIYGMNCPDIPPKCVPGFNCADTQYPLCFPNRVCDNPVQECPVCKEDGQTFAHPLNCDWYYQCQGKVAVPMKCGCGFLYNTKHNVCDYPCNVDCNNRVKRATPLNMFCQQNSHHSADSKTSGQGNQNNSKCG